MLHSAYILSGRLLHRLFHRLLQFKAARVRIAVICDGYVLLVRPWYGRQIWTLPGGGVKKGEPEPHAAARELHEETGITVDAHHLHYSGNYTCYESAREFVVPSYLVVVSEREQVKLSHEIVEAKWFPLDKLPSPLALPIERMLPEN